MSRSGRRLVGTVILLQDWDHENDEGSAKYWELFLDLLMVAAASSIAEGLQEDPTLSGIGNFILFYLLIVNGWMLYTHHMTTRFEDSSFLHSVILFMYVLGFASCITNASVETIRSLAIGAILQRSAIYIIFAMVYWDIPRARDWVVIFLRYLSLPTVCLVLSATLRSVTFLWVATLLETGLEIFLVLCSGITREQAVPINIDHSKDRLAILLLIMLGETVISSTIEFRRLAHAEAIDDYASYYWVLFWALVMVFFYNQLYFCVNPPTELHAFRRSKIRGTTLLLVHKLMCGSVLAVGTAVKLTIQAVVKQKPLTEFAIRLWSCSVGCSILFLLIQRLLHYFGMFPSGKEPPQTIRLMNAWWAVFAIASLIPFGGLILQVSNPIYSIAIYSSFLFVLCLIESTFTHFVEPHIFEEEEVSNIGHHSSQPLLDGQSVEHYNAT